MICDDVQTLINTVMSPHTCELLVPRHESHGDYAVHLAHVHPPLSDDKVETIVTTLAKNPMFESVSRVGPFINMTLHPKMLAEHVSTITADPAAYGSSTHGDKKHIAVEHTSPNPNKALHLGHLRNNVIGMALARILSAAGYSVTTENMDNNRGIAIARLMWGYVTFAHSKGETHDIDYWYTHQDEWLHPHITGEHPSLFVDNLYVRASEEFEQNETVQQQIRALVVAWESEDKKVVELWKTVIALSHEGLTMTLNRLNNHWDRVWHEHEHYKQGKEYISQGLAKGIFKKTDDGTVITQLEEKYGLPDTVLLKSDGTSLYITQDIALTDIKMKHHKPYKLLWIVGPEQTLAFKQLFAVCDQLGIGSPETFVHLPYGYMSIKGKGKMSSRKGNVVHVDDLLDQAIARAAKLIGKEDGADTVGIGAVKYSLLRVGRMQDIEFDFDESLSFEGNCGPYIQYTYARLQSVLRKGGFTPSPDALTRGVSEFVAEDRTLLGGIARFPEVVVRSADAYAPQEICTYVYGLAKRCNALYEAHALLTDSNTIRKEARMMLVYYAAVTLRNALYLLGIDVLEEM